MVEGLRIVVSRLGMGALVHGLGVGQGL